MQAIEPVSELRAGVLLLAVPMLQDPNFRRTVILLCEHTVEGSFGLVLNRPLDLRPGDLVGAMEEVSAGVGFGGPVQTDTMHYLHRLGDQVPEAEHVVGPVQWGGDFEVLRTLLETQPSLSSEVRFYLGYSGWESGQLQGEMDEGAWIAVEATDKLVFSVDPEVLWRTVLLAMGGTFALLANFPEDPRMN